MGLPERHVCSRGAAASGLRPRHRLARSTTCRRMINFLPGRERPRMPDAAGWGMWASYQGWAPSTLSSALASVHVFFPQIKCPRLDRGNTRYV